MVQIFGNAGFRMYMLGAGTILGIWALIGIRHWRSGPPPGPAYRFPTAELAALDWVVQKRFAVNPTEDFGAARIGTRHEYFKSETEDEAEAVALLKKRKQQVVLYVVGRLPALKMTNGLGPAFVQGPIYIAGGQYPKIVREDRFGRKGEAVRYTARDKRATELPDDEFLTALGKRVILDEKVAAGTSEMVGPWHLEAVPVVASSQGCVNCHNSKNYVRRGSTPFSRLSHDYVKLGDPLGVAIYCYRPDESETGSGPDA